MRTTSAHQYCANLVILRVRHVRCRHQLDGRDFRSTPVSSLRETDTGCFCAQILDALLPGKLRMSAVVWGKHGSVLEHEITNNYKVRKLSVAKRVARNAKAGVGNVS